MGNAKLEPLPDMGDDAMKDGCLSKKWVNRFLRRIRRQFIKVHLPQWLKGAAKFNEFEDSVELDLSNVELADGAGGAGTHVTPYEMDEAVGAASIDTWDITSPPVGTDGVKWNGPRTYYETITPDDVTTDSPSGDTTDWTLLQEYLLSRTCTYDSAGRLVAISAEFVAGAWTVR